MSVYRCPACAEAMLLRGAYCGHCGARLVTDERSRRRRWRWWGAGAAWAAIIVVVLIFLPVFSEGATHLSLRAKDPASLVIIVVALTLALGASGADLVRHRHDARPANGALVAGAGLMMFSLFGLAWGIASLGLCGFFVAASGLPLRQRTPGPGEVMDQEARRR